MIRWTVPLAAGLLAAAGCDYVRLLRPRVVRQLDPDVVRLVNFLPSVDDPNEALVARLIGAGGLVHAETGADGVMRARIRIPRHEYIWKPSVVMMPRGGVLELDFANEDETVHAALLPSHGDHQFLPLPARTRGVVRITLDQPGLYEFACPVSNHWGRGMVGLVIVRGETPPAARLDRPPQPRPRQ